MCILASTKPPFTHMPSTDLIDRICAYADSNAVGNEAFDTGLAGLMVLRRREPSPIESVLYNPLFCLILQGAKETAFGEHTVTFSSGESLIVSHTLPVVSRVTEASEQSPYVALVLQVDTGLVRSLYNEIGEAELGPNDARALDVGKTDAALIDAMSRLFDLVGRPKEAAVIAPLVLREIHFRLLLARHGSTLRQLLQRGSYADRIEKVIARIRESFHTPLTVAELSGIAGMSPSAFHEHFKALTATTPLQYQKDLRLLEARRLLSEESCSVSEAAFEVGYESPTQFSREYSRKFGMPPSAAKAGLSLA